MYYKETSFEVIDTDIFDGSMLKQASIDGISEKYDPDFFYVRVRAISAGEYFGSNKNADYFSEAELVKSHHTFLDAHVFKNHENKDVAKAIGSIVSSNWNNDMKCVELIIKIDRSLAPTIVRGFEKGFTTDVSMGCRVDHTVCSICGNKAKTRAEFCSHVKTMRNKVNPDGSKCFEYNHGPRFHDLSIVLNGADRTAKALEIYRTLTPEMQKAAATCFTAPMSLEDSLLKVASEVSLEPAPTFSFRDSITVKKLAGFQKEIVDKLYILALLDRMDNNGTLTDEELEDIIRIGREASLPLHLELSKQANLADLKNLAIGTTGVAAATNYYQGKRLRGEPTSSAENFVADNPGVLPLLFVLAGFPAYRKFKTTAATAAKNINPFKKKAFEYTDVFTKEANVLPECTTVLTENPFDSVTVDDIMKSAYNIDSDKLQMIKLALCLYQASREDLTSSIKEAYDVTDEDLGNFLKVSYDFVKHSLEKEANFMQGLLTANLFNVPKIQSGLTAPLAAGSLLDGYLLAKLFDSKPSKKVINEAEDIRKVLS